MLIPLGFWAASGGGAAGVPAFDLLEQRVLDSAESSVTFSSLSTYAADYQHLQIRAVVRSNSTGGTSSTLIFNSDSSASYSIHTLHGNGSAVDSDGYTSITYAAPFINIAIATSPSNAYRAGIIDILDPFETTKNTTLRVLEGGPAGTGSEIRLNSGAYLKTDAVGSVTIGLESSTYTIGSRFSLYGIKAA